MSADTKWEAVENGDLKPGDKVRLIHGNGDVLHGKVTDEGIYALPICTTPTIWQECGYSFERAVPERTLPAGLYIGKDEEPCDTAVYRSDGESIETDGNGSWEPIDEWDTIDDLVRLVPVTEVEEAEKRTLRRVHDVLACNGRFLGSVDLLGKSFDAYPKEATNV